MTGQINRDCLLGDFLYKIARHRNYKYFLDVGTWNGQGSTRCLIDGLRERTDLDSCVIYSLETNLEMYQKACTAWTPCPSYLRLIHGRISGNMMNEEEIRNHPLFSKISLHYDLHFKNDCSDFLSSPLISIEHVDVAVLDGGEFCGVADWEAVSTMNPHIVVLDDTKVIKNEAVLKKLQTEGWRSIAFGDDRNGWAILENPLSTIFYANQGISATIDLCGGLGNQLFQIFFMTQLALETKTNIGFPNKYMVDPKRHAYYNLFRLITLVDTPLEGVLSRVKVIPTLEQKIIFQGYFQSYKYFDKIDPHDFIRIDEPSQRVINSRLQYLRSFNRPLVSVHVRRGDYLLAPKYHDPLNVDYYKNAIRILRDRGIVNPVLVIFSEDKEWCDKNISGLGTCIYISELDYVELFIMAGCDHNIVAKSSFSWWGAFLNKKSDKIVIYPQDWSGIDIPESWLICRTKQGVEPHSGVATPSVYINGKYHHKNEFSLRKSIEILKWKITPSLDDADIVFSPSEFVDISKYPTKKFILGPHFSVFPENSAKTLNNIHNNAIYIQPSQEAVDIWVKNCNYTNVPVKEYAFGVDTEKFKPTCSDRTKIFVYVKQRAPWEIGYLLGFLAFHKIPYELFTYGSYKEEDYLTMLKNCQYGIWLGRHESQGFALEEALSMNVPLLVWNVTHMGQEHPGYAEYTSEHRMSSNPYWDDRCGEVFYDSQDLEKTFFRFQEKLTSFRPRDYILENLTIEKRTVALEKLIESFLHA
jgi:hypothetical protein